MIDLLEVIVGVSGPFAAWDFVHVRSAIVVKSLQPVVYNPNPPSVRLLGPLVLPGKW